MTEPCDGHGCEKVFQQRDGCVSSPRPQRCRERRPTRGLRVPLTPRSGNSSGAFIMYLLTSPSAVRTVGSSWIPNRNRRLEKDGCDFFQAQRPFEFFDAACALSPKQAAADAKLFSLNRLPYTFCLMAIKLV